MSPFDNLQQLFMKFPGVGPRQAKRFAYFLLRQGASYRKELMVAIEKIGDAISQCPECFRYFENSVGRLCDVCASSETNKTQLLIVEKDVDLDSIKRSGLYNGRYFILGGLLPLLERNPQEKIRIKELIAYIQTKAEEYGLKEIIFALSLNQEGDNTMQYVKKTIEPFSKEYNITVSSFGRGLSTGIEIEYSDPETLESAFLSRTNI